mgnify:CR=1 FL=1
MLETPNVLFVDDDERLLESLKIVLRREPYTVLTASSIEAAKQVLATRRVDVIVCDDRLPAQSGTSFLTELKNDAHPAVRIVLSGGGLPTAQRAINEAGVFRFLAKPCTSKAIAAAVRESIEMSFERTSEIRDFSGR